VLIDPVVANLLSGSAVTTNTASIAAATTGLVTGAAADGTTQVILRIPASTVSQSIAVAVINDQGAQSTSVTNDGGLTALGRQHFYEYAHRGCRYHYAGTGSLRYLPRVGEFLARNGR
jgi:hypothetical protein